MPAAAIADWERRLGRSQAPGTVGGEEIAGLPEPVQRHLTAAIRSGSALTTAVGLKMHGRIKVGRWLPFRARQVLSPHEGFLWTARAAGLIAGSDRYLDGVGVMHWKAAGLITVAQREGPDVSKSAAGRGGAEAVWVPTALLPRFGVTWSAADHAHITARYTLGQAPVDVTYTLESDGHIRSLIFDRWPDHPQHRKHGLALRHRSLARRRVLPVPDYPPAASQPGPFAVTRVTFGPALAE